MIRLVGPFSSGLTTGGAGTSGINVDTPTKLSGRMYSLYVKYNDSPPATTDVVIKTKGSLPAAPSRTFITLTDKNTSNWFDVRVIPHDTLGVALSALTIAEPVAFDDVINIAVAQANDGDSVDVWFLLDC